MPDQPSQQPPPIQRLRIRYAKRGRLRFTSHRDFGRAFERAVRRAGLPIAYSSGFHPHPRISYANAAPTGAASEAEYLEINLSVLMRPDDVRLALDTALPAGLDILDVVVAEANTGALADRLEASCWRIALPGVPVEDAESAVAMFLSRDAIEVDRMTKRGIRTFDCRSAVVSLRAGALSAWALGALEAADAADSQPCAILELVVRHGTPAVRPDDILAGLRETAGLVAPVPPLQTRIAQGPLDPRAAGVGDPLDPDRDATTMVATAERSGASPHVT
ncbi:MAG: TIGR03936 family radical SAM-associated protein [Nocardioidaceae bacterium]